MPDNIEKFIGEHRDELDMYSPPDHLWGNIKSKVDNRKKTRRLYYAAACVVLLGIGAAAWVMKMQDIGNRQAGGREVTTNPDIRKAEVYYTSIVETKKFELDHFSKEYPDLCNDLDKELVSLDTTYRSLKAEYLNSDGSPAVQQALIENLQARVQLLNEQLQLIQNLNRETNVRIPPVKSM